MSNRRLTVVLMLSALVIGGCGKGSTSSPTSPTPVATSPNTAPTQTPTLPPPLVPEPTPPTPTPPSPSTNPPVYTTLNPMGTVAGSLDIVWSERVVPDDRQVYDDFVIPAGATIRTISWQGMRFSGTTLSSFYVAIMADGGDRHPVRQYANQRPVALWSATYSADQVNERLEVSRACENTSRAQCGYYDYSVGMTTPFVAAAGTRYWVMIQSESPYGQGTGFCWRKGTRDNGFATGNLAGTTFPWDMAFALRP